MQQQREIYPRRSVLYMPGANARALEKARSLPADALILDLEDSVAPESKVAARDNVVAALRQGGYGNREVAVRINGLESPWFSDDVATCALTNANAIVLPKAESAEDIDRVSDELRRVGASDRVKLWAMIESPLAVLRAAEIAGAARHARSRLNCLIVGLNDLAKETRIEIDPTRSGALTWLSMIVAAARAYGLDVLDSAFNNFRDHEGLRGECRQGRSLGFDGKTLIHPDQIETANQIFAPVAADITWSRKIIAAFAQPENRGKGVIKVEGRMVEFLHLASAKRLIELDEAIARLGSGSRP